MIATSRTIADSDNDGLPMKSHDCTYGEMVWPVAVTRQKHKSKRNEVKPYQLREQVNGYTLYEDVVSSSHCVADRSSITALVTVRTEQNKQTEDRFQLSWHVPDSRYVYRTMLLSKRLATS